MLAWYNLHILQTLNKEMFNLLSKNFTLLQVSPYHLCEFAPEVKQVRPHLYHFCSQMF